MRNISPDVAIIFHTATHLLVFSLTTCESELEAPGRGVAVLGAAEEGEAEGARAEVKAGVGEVAQVLAAPAAEGRRDEETIS